MYSVMESVHVELCWVALDLLLYYLLLLLSCTFFYVIYYGALLAYQFSLLLLLYLPPSLTLSMCPSPLYKVSMYTWVRGMHVWSSMLLSNDYNLSLLHTQSSEGSSHRIPRRTIFTPPQIHGRSNFLHSL